jgi:hypothetical protein
MRAMEGRVPHLPVTKYDVEVPKALLAGSAPPYSNVPLAKREEWRYGADEPLHAVRIVSARGCEYDISENVRPAVAYCFC